MYIERREANDWPWEREILLADNVPFDELKACDYLQVFELLEQSKGVLNWVCRQ